MLEALPLDGGGLGGGDKPPRANAEMKKHPIAGARDRARSLRRDMTDAEKSIWRILRLYQIDGHRFRRQVPLGHYIADFVCHDARLIIEIDGGQHQVSAPQGAKRTRFLQDRGIGFYASGTTRCCRTSKACVRRSPKTCGVTPSQPSPIEGEGFDNILDHSLRPPRPHGAEREVGSWQ
jgi:very-short-patch-repair endonuclease